VIAASAITVVGCVLAARRSAIAGADPWGADELEWTTESPPPAYIVVAGVLSIWALVFAGPLFEGGPP